MDTNEQLAQLGVDALRDLYNNLTSAKAFALEQAPEVCRQIISWEITSGLLCLAAMVVTMIPIFVVIFPCGLWRYTEVEEPKEDGGNPVNHRVGMWASVLLLTLMLIIGALISFNGPPMHALKAYIAPKVVLIEVIGEYLGVVDTTRR